MSAMFDVGVVHFSFLDIDRTRRRLFSPAFPNSRNVLSAGHRTIGAMRRGPEDRQRHLHVGPDAKHTARDIGEVR